MTYRKRKERERERDKLNDWEKEKRENIYVCIKAEQNLRCKTMFRTARPYRNDSERKNDVNNKPRRARLIIIINKISPKKKEKTTYLKKDNVEGKSKYKKFVLISWYPFRYRLIHINDPHGRWVTSSHPSFFFLSLFLHLNVSRDDLHWVDAFDHHHPVFVYLLYRRKRKCRNMHRKRYHRL